ncbi:hypothetical protein OAJ83_03065 [Candidatus Nitrosopelagicus sp.]|nr:hypothetical protein [Candidatus Nitrosopelagicus sp.]
MGSYSVALFSLLLISSIVLISSFESSFADEIIATSTGFESSTILELKNIRGNTANIDTVRIWLSEENEFKSFKTEQGWIGKNTPQGVIVFTSQKEVNPGEGVKFGIKTEQENPIINWKALDSEGEIISSASTTVTEFETPQNKPELNQPKIVTIKDESNFRFIPEKPTSNSDFRVVGENFVPNQSLDFYIENKLKKSIKVDSDGKILFTAKAPVTKNDERTEFILRDSGGNEKTLSIRIPLLENREIPDIIKLSLGNTPQQVKRGDTITLTGMATPNTTLTITSKHTNGNILAISTIEVGFNGKWNYDNLFSPDLELGQISIEVDDGKSTALRNIEVISAKLINISSIETMYEPGEKVTIDGTAIPNEEMSVIVEDSIGAEIFSRTVSVSDSGNVNFDVDIPRGAVEGTYVLLAFQGNEEGVTIFGIGQEPEPILILRTSSLNFPSNENARVTIQGQPNAQVSIILIDSADREKFSDSINLGPSGRVTYEVETVGLPAGAYTLNAKRGESSGSVVFTTGLKTGSGAISVQTTRDDYKLGEHVLILGNTGSINVLLDIIISNPDGTVIKKVETFSDRFGLFKIDNFRIPLDGEIGKWTVNAKSGGNFKETEFRVSGESTTLSILTDKNEYEPNELVNLSGTGARSSATITMKIFDAEGEKITELNINAKNNGDYITIWQIPADLEPGEYEITADDGASNTSTKFIIN